jgi:tetratricopeptide (TPR) repeat protein
MDKKRHILKLLKPIFWGLSKILSIIPSFRYATKAIEGDRKIKQFEKDNKIDEARSFRKRLISKIPQKYLGPIWRSEGMDHLYNLKNYKTALLAFENAIACIEGDSLICAYQYGVSEPFQIYYGAAVAAICLDDKPKAKVYYSNFSELAARSKDKERCREQLDWLDRQLNSSRSQKNIIN